MRLFSEHHHSCIAERQKMLVRSMGSPIPRPSNSQLQYGKIEREGLVHLIIDNRAYYASIIYDLIM